MPEPSGDNVSQKTSTSNFDLSMVAFVPPSTKHVPVMAATFSTALIP
jgi:hypothetical protein